MTIDVDGKKDNHTLERFCDRWNDASTYFYSCCSTLNHTFGTLTAKSQIFHASEKPASQSLNCYRRHVQFAAKRGTTVTEHSQSNQVSTKKSTLGTWEMIGISRPNNRWNNRNMQSFPSPALTSMLYTLLKFRSRLPNNVTKRLQFRKGQTSKRRMRRCN